LGALRPQRPLSFDFGDLKLRDLAKLWFFKLIITKSNFKKSLMTSFKGSYRYYFTEKRHQITSQFFPFWALPIKISGYASVAHHISQQLSLHFFKIRNLYIFYSCLLQSTLSKLNKRAVQ